MTEDTRKSNGIAVGVAVAPVVLLLLYNVGASLYALAAGAPLQVWKGAPWAALPGLPVQTESVPVGSVRWWAVLVCSALPLLGLSFVVVRRLRRLRCLRPKAPEATGTTSPAPAPAVDPGQASAAGTAPAGIRRLPLVDPKYVRRARNTVILLWGLVGAAALIALLLGDLEKTLTYSAPGNGNGLIYAGIVGLGHVAVWYGFRRAQRTVIAFSEDGLALEKGGRLIWQIPWDDVAGWHRVTGARHGLKAIVVESRSGAHRRIDTGWIGMASEGYSTLLEEMKVRTGGDEGEPVEVGGGVPVPFVVLFIFLALMALAFLTETGEEIMDKITYWGIR